MDSSAVFWTITLLMSVLAFSFIATPLIGRGHRNGMIGFGTALPVFAAGVYLFVGSPQAASLDRNSHAGDTVDRNSPAEDRKPIASVASLVDGLAERLNDNPSDSKSWLLLARSYKHLGRVTEAKEAYDRAAALGEYDEGLAALADKSTAVSGAQLKGSVSLSSSAQEIVLPTDTVFVFARAREGPSMPVAALQRSASELPFDFVLSDSQSLSADVMLSSVDAVTVTARISRSGVATDALKNLEARSPNIAVADGDHLNLIVE